MVVDCVGDATHVGTRPIKKEYDSVQEKRGTNISKKIKNRRSISTKAKEAIAKGRCGRIRKSSQKGDIVILSKRQMRHDRDQKKKKREEV